MELMTLGLGLLSGGGGGLIAGKLMNSNIGTIGRAITGIAGGTGLLAASQYIPGLESLFSTAFAGISSEISNVLGSAGFDVTNLLGGAVSAGVGGTVLTFMLGGILSK